MCTLNATKVTEAFRSLLGVDHAGFDAMVLAESPGAGGVVLLPYLDGERTPNRPDATGQSVSLGTSTTERWFNTSAFVLQPIYQFGNAARNSIPGPAGFMLDSNVQKNFRIINDNHQMQFRWEAYNLLNHPVWGFPNTNLSNANFGRISSTAVSMRQMQFALKYVF